MENNQKAFYDTSVKLSRNPLGIIALFIILVYGIAGLLLGYSIKFLSDLERLLMIGFLVFFPLIVLITFYFLVTKHHVKLYSPQDFRSDDAFLFKKASPKEQAAKLLEESFETGSNQTDNHIDSSHDEKEKDSSTATQTESNLDFQHRDQCLSEINSRLNAQRSTLERIALAEELALENIELKYSTMIHRGYKLPNGFITDGYFKDCNGNTYLIEVKFIESKNAIQFINNRVIPKLFGQLLSAAYNNKFKVILYIVTSDKLHADQIKNIQESTYKRYPGVQVIISSLSELEEKNINMRF